jgi:hypothetical protein
MMTPEERAKRAAELVSQSDDELVKILTEARKKKDEELERNYHEARAWLVLAIEEYGPGRAALVRGEGGCVVVHMPTREERIAAENVHTSDKAKASTQREARERLIRQCLYYPDKGQWEEMARQYPNMVTGVSLACVELGKAGALEEEGK